MRKKKIGIIGGLGPQAGVEFCRLLVEEAEKSGARKCEDFPEFVLFSLSMRDLVSVTSQEELFRGEQELLRAAIALERTGVGLVVVACNTAHLFTKPVQVKFGNRFISIVEAVVAEVKNRKVKKVGLLASPTMLRSGLYARVLKKGGVKVILPVRSEMLVLEEAIEAVIRGQPREEVEAVLKIVRRMKKAGAGLIILGCTELSLIPALVKDENSLDSSRVLARVLLKKIG